MKVLKGAIVLALFLGTSQAIVLKTSSIDTEYEDSVKEEEDSIKSSHSKAGITKRLAELQAKDSEIVSEYTVQLDQSQRNIDQGEMGQSLAQSKIMSIKNSFDLLSTNIQEEAVTIKEQADLERKTDKSASPDKTQENVNALKKRTDQIMVDLEKVSGMESDLKDKGADVPSQDDLNQIREKFNLSIK